jgi:hypothetical protein
MARFIGPSVLSVEQGELNQTHPVDAFRLMEVRIIFFVSVAYHVKISKKDPGGVGRGSEGLELEEEGWTVLRGGRGVDVSNDD